jgi:antitoxin (DNA-binding transcriptional repressor) of toxin-antitoxin stability system
MGGVSEPEFTVRAEEEPSWAEIVRHAERGESVSVIAHGDHVADIVPSEELDRLRETIEVLSDTELVRELREGAADAREGRVVPAEQIAMEIYTEVPDARTREALRALGSQLDR